MARLPHSRAALLFPALFLAACASDNEQTKVLQAPVVEIQSPASGDSLKAETSTHATAIIQDNDGDVTTVVATWTVDGTEVCTGSPDAVGAIACDFLVPTTADAELKIAVEDADGQTAEDAVSFLIIPQEAPTLTLLLPEAEGRYYADHELTLSAEVADTEDAPEALVVNWTSSRDGALADVVPASDGEALTTTLLSAGEHVLTATVTDTTGRTAAANVIVEVGEANSAPTCGIRAPTDGEVIVLGQNAVFAGTVGDVDIDATALAVAWTSSIDGTLSTDGADSAGATGFATASLSAGTHILTLTATDELGLSCADSVTVKVGSPPMVTIVAPADGATFDYADEAYFAATVSDPDEPADGLTLAWTDDVDGVRWSANADSAGVTQYIDATLSSGDHVVTLRATDADGLYTEALVTLTIGCPTLFYADDDGDGFGAGAPAPDAADCSAPAGWVADHTDCDDSSGAVHPTATEVCNGVDDDCDGGVDLGAVDATAWYTDADADGFGDASTEVFSCDAPVGSIAASGDCNDGDADVSPAATEVCSSTEIVDDNCDGAIDEGFVDTDADGTPDCRDVCPVWVGPDGVAGDGSEANPYASINDAIALRGESCDAVVIEAGTYEETVILGSGEEDLSGMDTRNVSLTSAFAYRYGDYRDLVDLDGDGFPDDVDCADDPEDGYQVIITPDPVLSLGPGLVINGGQDASTQITGLTFFGGTGTDQWGDPGDTNGGGLYIEGSSPTIDDVVVRCNVVTAAGGGMRANDADFVLTNSFFQKNETTDNANGAGGAAWIGYSSPQVLSNVFMDNASTTDISTGNPDGGAILISNSYALIHGNWFEGNTCDGIGGAIRSASSDAIISHNVMIDNYPDGIALSYYDAGVVSNNTILDNNTAGIQTYTVSGYGSVTTVIANNIIMGHTYGIYLRIDDKLVAVEHNDVYDNTTNWKASFSSTWTYAGKNGNISVDPDLVAPDYRDMGLNMLSTCNNAGTTWAELDAWVSPYGWSVTTDFDGDTLGTTDGLDIGAYGP